jgi:hypothetical protein
VLLCGVSSTLYCSDIQLHLGGQGTGLTGCGCGVVRLSDTVSGHSSVGVWCVWRPRTGCDGDRVFVCGGLHWAVCCYSSGLQHVNPCASERLQNSCCCVCKLVPPGFVAVLTHTLTYTFTYTHMYVGLGLLFVWGSCQGMYTVRHGLQSRMRVPCLTAFRAACGCDHGMFCPL